MKFLNAFALVLTVLLYLVRQRCVFAGVCPTKRHTIASACSGADRSFPYGAQAAPGCMAAARSPVAYTCGRPKYKRDPDIQIDNEDIGVGPVE